MVMHGAVFKYFSAILLFCSCLVATSHISNDTNDIRQPRVSGRIVKLYSGSRPEPIYCAEEGFQSDPTNCAIFYRCVKSSTQKFTVFRFQCGPGTVYDPETEVCNHPRSTKRSECWNNAGLSPSTEKHQENEIPKDWPLSELPSPISTSKPVYPDEHLKETNAISTAYPLASTTKRPDSLNSVYPWSPASTQKTSPVITPSNSQKGDLCTSDGFMGDSENCRKFYRCVSDQRGGFIRYEFSCSETTIWDDNVHSCNHPWAVRKRSCGRNYIEEFRETAMEPSNNVDSSISSTQQQTQISYGSRVSQTQTQISHGSVIQNQTQINYGDRNKKQNEESKQNQTQISYGSAISQYQTQINHGSKGVQSQLQIDHSKDASQSQTQKYQTTSKRPATQEDGDQGYGGQSDTETSSNNYNDNECTESGFMGDKYDCKKFYRCVDNGRGGYTKYDFTCGEGTVWDSEIEACNHAWAVKKCGGKVPESSSQNTVTNQPTQSTQQQTTTTEEEEDVGYGNPNQQPSQTSTTAQNPVVTENNQNKPEQITTTKQPPNQSESNECYTSGFMGDKNDCKKFYRCVDNGKGGYTRYEFSCGEGTVWDSQIDACNHAWAVEKCGGEGSSDIQKHPTSSAKPTMSDEYVDTSQTTQTEKGPEEDIDEGYNQPSPSTSTTQASYVTSDKICTKEGFVGDQTDCRKFYRCVDNGKGDFIRYEFSCGEGTVWDSEINTCNYETSVKTPCSSSSSNQNEGTSEGQENSQSTTTTKQPSQSSEIVQTSEHTTQKLPDQKPPDQKECTREGFIGDENDCKNFYRCVDNGKGGYIKYEFRCGEGTVWDQEILGCNYNNGMKECKSSPQSQPSSSSEGSTENEVSPTPSSTEKQQTTQKPESESSSQSSSGQCTSEGFYANPDDCKKFYRCVDNGKGGFTKYDFSCGDGTIWVQEIQACDHDNDVSTCSKPNNSSPSTTTTTKTIQATEDHAGSSESILSTTTVSQSQQPNKEDDEYPSETSSESPTSDDKCTSEGFYPNKNDCRRFYRCVDNGNGGYTKYDFSCGEGTAWDSDTQTCNHISEVKSCQYQDTQSKPMHDEDSTQNSSTSPGDGTTSSPFTESSKPTSNNTCEQEGYYGNSEDCKKFYRCVDNGNGGFTKYDFDCGEGTIWDQEITACNHPQDVSNPSCKQSDSSTLSTTSSSTTSSSTTSSSTTSSSLDQSSSSTTENNNGSSDCSQENSSKKPANKNVNCTEAGYYADPDDCKKFYRCVDWDGDGKRFSVYHFECGEGTVWDPALDTCNHEDSVYPPRDCSGSQSQAGTVDQEPTTTEETKQEETTTQQSTTEQSTTEESTTTQKSTESGQENTTAQNEQTTSAEQTTEQTTTQTTEHTDQTTEQTTTTQQTTEVTTVQQTTEEQTSTQQITEQTTQESTTSQQTTQESSTTESNDQQSTTEQLTESPTQQTTMESQTEESQTGESQTEESQTGESQTEESQTEESQTEQSQTEQNQTEESQTEQSQTEQSQTEQSQTEESQTEENQTEENQTDENQTEDSQTEESESTTESSSSSEKECPETDDDQNVFVCPTSFRRHPKYCNLFYQCTEDDNTHDANIATFHCPNNTIYDESQVKCVEEDKADKKCNGEIAQKRRYKRLGTTHKEPIVVTEERLKCPTVGHFPFEKYECSSAFLKCQKSKTNKIRGYVYQCPQGFIYWSVSRRCEPKDNVRDCKHSYNNWNGRWEIPIERRNVAP